MRLAEIVRLLKEVGFRRGHQSQIARRLGVSRSTISRDFAVLKMLESGWDLEAIYLTRRLHRREDAIFRN